MSMVINTNISALNTVNQLNKNSNSMNSALEKLSSGYQINSAADDAAGLAISEKMRSQIRGLDQASDNAQDAISLTQTADGALDETESILQRMRELAVQSSSDSLTDDDRESIQDEVDQLRQEIDRISDDTEYNTKSLLDGSLSSKVTVSGNTSSSVDLLNTVSGIGTTSGTYSVAVTTAATKATLSTISNQYSATASASSAINGTYVGQEIEINDSTVTISDGDTLTGLVNKINSITDDTGVTASLTDVTGYATSITGTATAATGISSTATATIDSTNNTFLLTEGSGTATTITIADGNYTSASALETAINNAISDAKVNATATIGSDGTITFTSNDITEDGATATTLTVADSGTDSSFYEDYIASTGSATTVSATRSYITLSTDEYGSDSEISLTADNTVLNDLFAAVSSADTSTTNVTENGTDIEGTINGIAATGEGNNLVASDGLTVAFVDGTAAGTAVEVDVDNSNILTFQIGANEGQTMTLSIDNMSAYSLGVAEDDTGTNGLDVSTAAAATSAITSIDSAISKVSAQRAKLGATENRLEHTINNLDTTSENVTSAESNIRDTDMASVMAEYTQKSVLTQAATAMLAQANQQPSQVLKLLQ